AGPRRRQPRRRRSTPHRFGRNTQAGISPPERFDFYKLALVRLSQEKERHAGALPRFFIANAALLFAGSQFDAPTESARWVLFAIAVAGVLFGVMFYLSMARMQAFIEYWQAQARALEAHWDDSETQDLPTVPDDPHQISIYAPYRGEHASLWSDGRERRFLSNPLFGSVLWGVATLGSIRSFLYGVAPPEPVSVGRERLTRRQSRMLGSAGLERLIPLVVASVWLAAAIWTGASGNPLVSSSGESGTSVAVERHQDSLEHSEHGNVHRAGTTKDGAP
ncbi:MAG: hypothetical protein O7F10_03855, partial [Deltaproteobacteria bacterium]|nr:hypothetical protein [Deltaproteobacteria bacterium]